MNFLNQEKLGLEGGHKIVKIEEYFPQEEIWKAAETFNPTNYNADKWMSGASKAGFKYAVLTTKHHDGYVMRDSDWALMGVRQSLDGFDLVKPFVDACEK